MKDRTAEGLGQAAEQGRRLMETAREQVERFTGRNIDAWTDDMRSFVQKRPLQAVLITVAVGYILGKMLKRG